MNLAIDSRIRVGLFYGGRSAEHEITVRSMRNVYDALDTNRYAPVLIAISKQGVWHSSNKSELFSHDVVPETDESVVTLAPGQGGQLFYVAGSANEEPLSIDIAFPVLHGPQGEDGSIQGLYELAGIPYVGSGVLGSAVGMDKDVMKRLLHDAGLDITPHHTFTASDRPKIDATKLFNSLGATLFVKPASMGSSVGVSRVTNETELHAAVALAFRYDTKIIVEAGVDGIEVECAVLGNIAPQASVLGSITAASGTFYSYDAKYASTTDAVTTIPAAVSETVAATATQIALAAYAALEAEGMARVDMFVTADQNIVVNEINTIPGFTNISMYPKLWEASGLSLSELLDKLIYFAIERFERDSK